MYICYMYIRKSDVIQQGMIGNTHHLMIFIADLITLTSFVQSSKRIA